MTKIKTGGQDMNAAGPWRPMSEAPRFKKWRHVLAKFRETKDYHTVYAGGPWSDREKKIYSAWAEINPPTEDEQ